MAHDDAVRQKLRGAYVFDQQTLECAALTAGVPFATGRNWKRRALADGDDWDRARRSQMAAGGDIEGIMRQALAAAVQQMQAIMAELQVDADTSAADKAKLIASLADSFSKFSALASRVMPQADRLGIETGAVKGFVDLLIRLHPGMADKAVAALEAYADGQR